ncbi:unnamed protein product [Effrenium voratum]|uniref:Uncharacterized protein n=1 Tax=Effrenium voratum TaxID=2562239 RepID=A0AA36J2G7_9DINO|nr:unnamed protein product [Effrenium voratum]
MFGGPFAMGGNGFGGLPMGMPVIVRDLRADRSQPPREVTVRVGGVPIHGLGMGPFGPFPGLDDGLITHAIHEALQRDSVPVGGANATLELYHNTSPDRAEAIVQSQRMYRGSDGLAGGGIYFAESEAEARRKAHNHGAMLSATVRVGKVKVVHRSADASYLQLRSEGYDSVKILGRDSGAEYVVYNYDQVTNIRRV